jgi:CheY-like chemotaxis protein
VDVAEDGGAAVEKARATSYDVVLMDIQMPVLDGYDATRTIRAVAGGDAPRIIGLTANALQGERERCVEAGMDDYLAKPFKPEELFAAVEAPVAFAAYPRVRT